MKKNLQAIDAKLEIFATTKQTSSLEDAILIVEGVKEIDKQGQIDSQIRKFKTQAFLRILREVEQSFDPKFNSNDVPYLNIAPPSGVQPSAGAGMDPKAIKDARLRKQYESALAENAKKTAYSNQQNDLRRLQHEFQIRILNYVAFAYSGDPEAQNELTKLCNDAGVSKEFQAMIKSKVK